MFLRNCRGLTLAEADAENARAVSRRARPGDCSVDVAIDGRVDQRFGGCLSGQTVARNLCAPAAEGAERGGTGRGVCQLGPSPKGARSPSPRARTGWTSGECALEGGAVGRRPVRGEHDLNRQVEQRAQALEDLLARLALGNPAVEERQAGAVIDERVADNDRSAALDPEHMVERRLTPGARLDADRQLIAGCVWLP